MSKSQTKVDNLIKVIKIMTALVLLTPLVVVPKSYFPFIFWKVIILRIAVEIIFVIYLMLVLKDKKYWPKCSCLFWSVAVFLLVSILTTITSQNFYRSFWSNQERMGGLITMLHFGVLFFVLIGVFQRKEDWYWLFKISFVVSLIASLYAFLQKINLSWSWVVFGGVSRLSSTIGNPAFFAAYLVPHIFLGIVLTLAAKTRRSRLFFLIAVFFELAILYWTATRGAIFSLGVAVFCFSFFLLGQRTKRSLRVICLIAVAVLLLMGSLLYIFRENSWLQNNLGATFYRLSHISFGYFSGTQQRLLAWKIALKSWQQRPILGWGPENYILAFNANFDPQFLALPGEQWFDRAHNKVLDLAVNSGLLGVISYLVIFICVLLTLFRFWIKRQRREWWPLVVISFFIAFFLQNLFVFDTSSTYLLFFLIIGFVHINGLSLNGASVKTDVSPEKSLPDPSRSKKRNGFAVLLIVLVFLIMFKVNLKPAVANYRLAMVYYEKDGDAALNDFKSAMFMKTYVQNEARREFVKGLMSSANQSQKEGKSLAYLQPWLELAVSQTRQSLVQYPRDPASYLYLGRLYNLLAIIGEKSALTKAEAILLKAKKITPQRLEIYYELGVNQAASHNYKAAIQTYQEGVDLAPDLPKSHWQLGYVLFLDKQFEKSLISMLKAEALGYFNKQQNTEDLLILAKVYIEAGQKKHVPGVYLEYLERKPNNLQVMALLAGVYNELGKKSSAQEVAKQILELDPNARGLVEDFIDSLDLE